MSAQDDGSKGPGSPNPWLLRRAAEDHTLDTLDRIKEQLGIRSDAPVKTPLVTRISSAYNSPEARRYVAKARALRANVERLTRADLESRLRSAKREIAEIEDALTDVDRRRRNLEIETQNTLPGSGNDAGHSSAVLADYNAIIDRLKLEAAPLYERLEDADLEYRVLLHVMRNTEQKKVDARVYQLAKSLTAFHREHGCYPESDFNGLKTNFYEWSAKQVGLRRSRIIGLLKEAGIFVKDQHGKSEGLMDQLDRLRALDDFNGHD